MFDEVSKKGNGWMCRKEHPKLLRWDSLSTSPFADAAPPLSGKNRNVPGQYDSWL